jgi:hypothetical protein
MVDWVNGLIIPVIQVAIIGGVIVTVLYFIGKAFWNAWSKQAKFFVKYKIMRKKYPEHILRWCVDAIDKGIGYYDAKKFLLINMIPTDHLYETLYIYDQIINEMSDMKGGIKNVRKFKGDDRKDQSTELPKY